MQELLDHDVFGGWNLMGSVLAERVKFSTIKEALRELKKPSILANPCLEPVGGR